MKAYYGYQIGDFICEDSISYLEVKFKEVSNNTEYWVLYFNVSSTFYKKCLKTFGSFIREQIIGLWL